MNDDNSNSTSLRPRPPKLPATREETLQHRWLKSERTLNDMVEDIHLVLIEEEPYRDFLEAVYDEDAVEGSCAIDNAKAAELIRDRAKKMGYEELAKRKLATISKALNVVTRRYKLSRKMRKNMVRGEIVPPDADFSPRGKRNDDSDYNGD